jgi:protein disulfide-isomerase
MKKLIVIALTIITTSTFAQDGVLANGEQYKAHAEGWIVDINEAYEISKKTGKPIMANFTGSDWCGWCKKLKAEVFDKAEFKKWADEKVVLVELDFPRRFQLPEAIKQQNYGLAQAFKVTGYPTIWVFNLGKDERGQFTIGALGKTGYVKGVEAFTSGVDAMIKQAAEAKKN